MLGDGAVRAACVYSVGVCLGSGTEGKAKGEAVQGAGGAVPVRRKEVLHPDNRNGNSKKVIDLIGEKAGLITSEEGEVRA